MDHLEITVALELNGGDVHLPRQTLDAAVNAYQTITQFEGFSTPGYSFASPDYAYAHDPDKTIDVYLGNPQGPDLPRRDDTVYGMAIGALG